MLATEPNRSFMPRYSHGVTKYVAMFTGQSLGVMILPLNMENARKIIWKFIWNWGLMFMVGCRDNPQNPKPKL